MDKQEDLFALLLPYLQGLPDSTTLADFSASAPYDVFDMGNSLREAVLVEEPEDD